MQKSLVVSRRCTWLNSTSLVVSRPEAIAQFIQMHRLFGTLGHGDLYLVSWRCFQLYLTLLLPNWDISILLFAASIV